MGVLDALLEGFDEAVHPRDFRGRFKAGDHVTLSHGMFGRVPARVTKVTAARVFVTSSDSRVSDTSMTHNQAAVKLEHMIGPHAVRPRLAKGQTANELSTRRLAARDALGIPGDRHGGFKVGDVIRYSTGSRAGGHGPVTMTRQPGLHTVVGLQRNGNLRVKHPDNGTTVDVPHQHAEKVSPLHPDYRGKVAQDAYAAQRAAAAALKAERAARLQSSAPAGALGALLEGFAAPAQEDPFPDQDYAVGDRVRVSVRGGKSVVGQVRRAHGSPATHAIIAPEGGSAHVKAPVGDVKLDTPARHALERKRAAAAAMRQAQQPAGPGKLPVASGAPARPGVGVLEAFAPAPVAGPETPAQSQARGAQQVAAAQKSIAAGWNASKHPRAQGGKFGYTTGGKRARRGQASSSRTLGVGASGALVRSVQRQLGVAADGKYGPQTRSAVTRFQQLHHLQVDGVVGAQTLAALRGHVNPQSVRPGPIPASAAVVKPHPAVAKTAAPVRIGGGIVV